MSWCDGKRMKTGLAAALIMVAASLSACQVRPLYATSSSVDEGLSSIAFSEAGDRVGQEVRNQLVFMTGRGAGEPENPAYEVELAVKSRTIGVLLEMSSDIPRAARVVVSADYELRKAGEDAVIKTGHRQSVALVDVSAQQFASIRAVRDAENRAARELAELIRADLAATIGR